MNQMYQRYAIALFSLALEEHKMDEYLEECEQLIDIFDKNPQLITILKDYGLSKEEKKKMLSSLFESKIEKNIYYFMCVIIDHQRGKYIKEILSEFIQVCFKRLNIKTGTIYSTYPLSEEQIKKIKQKVSITMDSDVRLVNKINKELVGGIKIQVDDYIIDYSLKHRLEQLKKELYNHRKEDHHEN